MFYPDLCGEVSYRHMYRRQAEPQQIRAFLFWDTLYVTHSSNSIELVLCVDHAAYAELFF